MKRQLLERSSKTDKVKPTALLYVSSRPEQDEYVVVVKPIWPTGPTGKPEVGSDDDLKDFAEKDIKSDMRKGFVYVKVINSGRVNIIFRGAKWLNENFLDSPRVKFHIPRTLEFTMKKRLPDVLLSHVPWNFLKTWVEKRFKLFLKDHQKRLFREKMKIMKKVNYNWFDYEADIQFNKVFVRMKTSVLITLGVAAGATVKAVQSAGKKDTDSWSEWDV